MFCQCLAKRRALRVLLHPPSLIHVLILLPILLLLPLLLLVLLIASLLLPLTFLLRRTSSQKVRAASSGGPGPPEPGLRLLKQHFCRTLHVALTNREWRARGCRGGTCVFGQTQTQVASLFSSTKTQDQHLRENRLVVATRTLTPASTGTLLDELTLEGRTAMFESALDQTKGTCRAVGLKRPLEAVEMPLVYAIRLGGVSAYLGCVCVREGERARACV